MFEYAPCRGLFCHFTGVDAVRCSAKERTLSARFTSIYNDVIHEWHKHKTNAKQKQYLREWVHDWLNKKKGQFSLSACKYIFFVICCSSTSPTQRKQSDYREPLKWSLIGLYFSILGIEDTTRQFCIFNLLSLCFIYIFQTTFFFLSILVSFICMTVQTYFNYFF